MVIVGPPGIMLAIGSAHDKALAVMMVPFYGYLILTSRHVRDDYWHAARSGLLLRERADALEPLSGTDALTQVANRLHFDARLEQEWTTAALNRQPLSLLMIDIDHSRRSTTLRATSSATGAWSRSPRP